MPDTNTEDVAGDLAAFRRSTRYLNDNVDTAASKNGQLDGPALHNLEQALISGCQLAGHLKAVLKALSGDNRILADTEPNSLSMKIGDAIIAWDFGG